MTNKEIWDSILAQIQLNVSPAIFTTWFKSTSIVSIENGEAVVATPNSFAKEWLEQKYHKQILKILRDTDGSIREVFFRVVKDNPATTKPKPTTTPPATQTTPGGQMGLDEFKQNRDTNLNPKYSFDGFIVGPYNELAHAAAWAVAKIRGWSITRYLFMAGWD